MLLAELVLAERNSEDRTLLTDITEMGRTLSNISFFMSQLPIIVFDSVTM